MTTTHAQEVRTLIDGETIRVGVRIKWHREHQPGSHLHGWYADDVTAFLPSGKVIELLPDEREAAINIGARELP